MMEDSKAEYEQYPPKVLNAPALFDLDNFPYGSELPIPDGVS